MSQVSFIKQRRVVDVRKDTRWDRIRKRHMQAASNGGANIKTKAVRRFLAMDFIASGQDCAMRGVSNRQPLDPVLVMDIRHKMSRKLPNCLPVATVAHSRNIDKCVAHNAVVEEHYIDHELQKFRAQLEKQHKRNRIDKRTVSIKALLRLDNDRLRRSVEATAAIIQDFYSAPLQALQEAAQDIVVPHSATQTAPVQVLPDEVTEEPTDDVMINENFAESIEPIQSQDILQSLYNYEGADESPLVLHLRTPSPLTPTDELLRPMREAAEEQKLQKRYVHFESPVAVTMAPSPPVNACDHNHEDSARSSNTSDGIESVISELAEEALRELQMEEKYDDEEEEEGEEVQLVVGELTRDTTDEHETSAENLLVVRGYHVPNMPEETPQPPEYSNNSDTSVQEDESVSCHEQNVIIAELFKARAHTNIVTLRRYFLKWMHFTTIQKIERENCSSRNDRVHMINAFLDKIRREKVRLRNGVHGNNCDDSNQAISKGAAGDEEKMPVAVLQTAKKYKNKIKVQQDIIDLQRMKLERQERMIMELKLNKLSQEARDARQELKDELKSVIRSGDPKIKAKAKCLQLIGNLRDEEDERLQARGALLVPKFLQKMQERSLERSVRHEQARQRRLQQDAEREAQKIAAEEAKRFEDEEAKRMRIEALREKRRQEKMAKVLKERERQRAVEQQRKAQEFYRLLLLRRLGFEVFRRILQRKRDNQCKCEQFRRQHYKRTYFEAWRRHCQLVRERKLMKADVLYQRLLKRHSLDAWQAYMRQARSQYNVAVDWYELHLAESYFIRWFGYMQRMRAIEETKMRQAISHHEWHLKWKVLDCWQRLQQLLQLEKETEERRQRWRMKIWELLPDYTPNRDDMLWK